MATAEGRLVAACVRELDKRRIFHFNLSGSNGQTGLPDRIALPAGRLLALEFKDPKHGRVSAKQRYVHELFAAAGFPVHVIRSVGELRALLDVDCDGEE